MNVSLLTMAMDILGLIGPAIEKNHTVYVHRLVALAFIDNPNGYLEVNHKDENKSNNAVDNLEWCDHTYNANYGTKPERTAQKNKVK